MRKGLFVLLAMALVVALAVPASAEMKLNGFYRVKPTMSNFLGTPNASMNVAGTDSAETGQVALIKTAAGGSGVQTDTTRMFTEMRNRLRFEVGDENVKGVTFFEIDGNFGDTGGQIGRNQGFAANGDSINLETKNVYVWFKIPGTTLDFTVGLQGYTDEFAGLLFGASDQAGVVANYKFAPVALRLTWLKISDSVTDANGDNTFKWGGNNAFDTDTDYYAVDVKFNPTKELTATLHGGYIRDTANKITPAVGYTKLDSYYLGANATFKLAPATLTGFFLYNFGTFEFAPGTPDLDIQGYAGSIRADANVGPGKVFLEGLYVSGDDNSDDDKFKSIINGSDFAILTSYYARPDLVILFPNADMINSAAALVLNPNNGGQGLSLIAAGYSQKFTDKVSAKIGAGYLRANKLDSGSAVKGKAMGTEINANVNYNITKGLDFGLYGAYCFLGSYYDRTDSSQNPEDLYVFNGRLNFAF
jgi:hypothetical protein